MFAVLALIEAQDALGAMVALRLSSVDLPEACHLAGEQWFPELGELPQLAYDFFGGGFDGQIGAPQATFAVDSEGLSQLAAARFADARVRLWAGDLEGNAANPGTAIGPLDLMFDGLITGEPVRGEDGVLRFTASVDDAWMDEPLLPLFAGTGGLEGPDELEGQAKPLALGDLRFAAGVQIDRVENVWMVSHAGFDGMSVVYDRVARLGASAGDQADLAALIAATIAPGSWATAKAAGLTRLGAPGDGKVSFDLTGDNAGAGGLALRAGAMIARVAQLAGGTVDSASLTALDVARPYDLALQLLAQTTARTVIQQLADSVGAVAFTRWTGGLAVHALGFGAAVADLAADGTSALTVIAVEEREKASPAWRIATDAEPTWQLHDDAEVATEFTWRGPWNADRVYRIDDLVTMPDGSAWVYFNGTASAGNVPGAGSAYWSLFGPGGGNTTTVAAAFPDIDASNVGDIYIAPDKTVYVLTESRVVIDGFYPVIEGFVPVLRGWERTDTQPVISAGETANWSGVIDDDGNLPEDSADVTRAVTGAADIVLDYDSSGALASPLPVQSAYKVQAAGGGDITSGVTWLTATQLASGQTTADVWDGTVPSIGASGILAINSGLKIAEAIVRVTATVNGVAIPAFSVKVRKVVAAPASGGGGSGDFASASLSGALINSGTFVQVGATLSVTTTDGTVDLTAASLSVVPAATPTGSVNVEAKWQHETSPSTWADIGAVANSDPDPLASVDSEGFPEITSGAITINRQATSIPTGSAQNFRLVARNSTGTRNHSFFGTISAQG